MKYDAEKVRKLLEAIKAPTYLKEDDDVETLEPENPHDDGDCPECGSPGYTGNCHSCGHHSMNEVSDKDMAAFKAKGGKIKNIPDNASGITDDGEEGDEDMMLHGADEMNARRIKKMRNEFDSHMGENDPMADEPDYGVQDDITSDPRHHLPTGISYSIKQIPGDERYGEPDQFLVWRHQGGSSSAVNEPGDMEIQSPEQAEILIARDAREMGAGNNYEVDYR